MSLSLKSLQFLIEFLNNSNLQIAIKDVEQISSDIIQVKNELALAIHASQVVLPVPPVVPPVVPATVETTTTTTTDTK